MIITNFDKFINESTFIDSTEYSKFKKSEGIPDESFFTDNLIHVIDINGCSVSFDLTIEDSKGEIILGRGISSNINVGKIEDGKIKAKYTINIYYELDKRLDSDKSLDSDNFDSSIKDLSTINLSILEMKDRCLANNKLNLASESIICEKNIFLFKLIFESDLDINNLKSHHEKWLYPIEGEYTDGIKKLKKMYAIKYNTNLIKHLTTDEDNNIISVAFKVNRDETYVIAYYDKKNKKFSIDEKEVTNSILRYREWHRVANRNQDIYYF